MAKKIAVIGGGVGGLAVAYNLMQKWQDNGSPPDARPKISVYEKSARYGGNADTARFLLNNPDSDGEPIERWADLGVNDFNTTAYKNIVKVMDKIGYVSGQNYRKLEDSTSYYTLDGSIAYTTGSSFTGVGLTMPPDLNRSIDQFMNKAAKDARSWDFRDYTVRQYIEELTPKYNWDPGLGPKIIYPRINGMYFVDEVDPTSMPLRSVMHYYQIQEGAGGHAPLNRVYFVGGASTWIDTLVNYMNAVLGINFMPNFDAAIAQLENGTWQVADRQYDVVVLATHADDALQCFASGPPDPAVGPVLAKVNYLNGLSVAHTYTGVLPPDRNAWKTYNILIHQPPSAATQRQFGPARRPCPQILTRWRWLAFCGKKGWNWFAVKPPG